MEKNYSDDIEVTPRQLAVMVSIVSVLRLLWLVTLRNNVLYSFSTHGIHAFPFWVWFILSPIVAVALFRSVWFCCVVVVFLLTTLIPGFLFDDISLIVISRFDIGFSLICVTLIAANLTIKALMFLLRRW